MTKLDLVRMNKTYVDESQLSEFSNKFSPSTRTSAVTMTQIRDMVEAQGLLKVKSLLRSNELPAHHAARSELWLLLCLGAARDSITDDKAFESYAVKFDHVSHETLLPIHELTDEMRVHRMLSEEGVKASHKVLYVISETHPHIRQFSRLLYAFNSLLLHYMDEEMCFNCVYALLKRKNVNYYLAPTEISLNSTCFVLRELAFRYIKPAALYMETHSTECENPAHFYNDWVLWIFKCLPFHYLVRIVDCYLVEGYKVLFRIALTLVKHFHKIAEPAMFKTIDGPDSGLRTMCENIQKHVSCDKLLKEAFGIRGFSKKEIDTLYHKTEQAVRSGQLAAAVTHPTPNVSRPKKHAGNPRNQLLIASKSKKSFKVDQDIHTQLQVQDIDSKILSKFQQNRVWSWLPPAEAVKDCKLVYTTNEHGYSLKMLYEKVDNVGPTLLVIKTINDEVFGSYCSVDWAQRHRTFDTGAQISYFGNGQSFVFQIQPEVQYPWVGKFNASLPPGCDMFQAGDRTMIMIGGGDGVAIQLDADLDHGRTGSCKTFDNMPLVESGEFRVQSIEIFAFT